MNRLRANLLAGCWARVCGKTRFCIESILASSPAHAVLWAPLIQARFFSYSNWPQKNIKTNCCCVNWKKDQLQFMISMFPFHIPHFYSPKPLLFVVLILGGAGRVRSHNLNFVLGSFLDQNSTQNFVLLRVPLYTDGSSPKFG